MEAIAVSKKTKKPLTIAASINEKDRDFYNKEVLPKIDGELVRYIGEADFIGKIEYLKKASCLLFPILWEEPFGLVMVEALACDASNRFQKRIGARNYSRWREWFCRREY